MSRMLAEIREQPQVLEKTLARGLKPAAALRRTLERRRPRLIFLAARGTSDNAAQFGRYLLEITTGIPVSLAAPSIFTLYESPIDLRDTLVIGLSQSGESTDVNLVLERAKTQNAVTIGITNEPRSRMASLAEHTLLVRAGRERSVAATKTYTGQLLMLYLIAQALGAPIRTAELERIPAWTSASLTLEPAIAELAIRYRFMDHAVVVGRGLNYANAFEFALKLMETCYVVAERFSSADFQHGPIAMVEASFPVFLFAPPGVTWPGLHEMLVRLESLRADTLLITDRSHESLRDSRFRRVVIPANIARPAASRFPAELYSPIPYIIPAQLLAACLAAEKGLNPDQPRTLSKVTKTL